MLLWCCRPMGEVSVTCCSGVVGLMVFLAVVENMDESACVLWCVKLAGALAVMDSRWSSLCSLSLSVCVCVCVDVCVLSPALTAAPPKKKVPNASAKLGPQGSHLLKHKRSTNHSGSDAPPFSLSLSLSLSLLRIRIRKFRLLKPFF